MPLKRDEPDLARFPAAISPLPSETSAEVTPSASDTIVFVISFKYSKSS